MNLKSMPIRKLAFVTLQSIAIATSLTFLSCTKKKDDSPRQAIKVETNMNPDLSVDENGLSKAIVVINTDKGEIQYRFYSEDAPNTVKRMVELINSGFYNGLKWHRVVPGFVIQGGDPKGDGTGGSGQTLKQEFNKRQHHEGTVAMARASDPDSADSQFYIALATHTHLDGKYTVFGQVVEGLKVLKEIRVGDKINWMAIR